ENSTPCRGPGRPGIDWRNCPGQRPVRSDRLRWPGSPRDGPPHRSLGRHYGWNIERLFSKLKAWLRSAGARTVGDLIEAMGDALRAIGPGAILGWFGHSGYRAGPSTGTLNRKLL